jgi:hypothetical protein
MHLRSRIFLSFTALIALCAASRAQNDDCATPQTVVGLGAFPFDNTTATTSSQQSHPFCPSIAHDLWYAWVAPATGNASLTTCNQTNFDSNIAVYQGPGCPTGSTNLCDDDSCGNLESLVNFPVLAGNTYMLEIGTSGGGSPGLGTFTLSIAGAPANDDCSSPVVLGTTGGGGYDNSQATTSLQGHATCAAVNNDLWYTWTASVTGTATIDTCGQSTMDTVVAAYLGSGCPTTASIGCDDNGCGIQSMATFPIVAGATYTLEIGSSQSIGGPGSFIVTEQSGGGGSTGTPFCFGDGSGSACPCGNSGASGHGCASSVSASGALLGAIGGASVSGDSLVLQGSGMAPNSSVLYYQGTSQTSGGSGAAFGDGLRCASGTVVRLATRTNDATGASGYGAPLGDTAVSVRGQLPSSGGTREYQAWYRNAAPFCTSSTFNLTNGLEIAWAP